jgi:GTPase
MAREREACSCPWRPAGTVGEDRGGRLNGSCPSWLRSEAVGPPGRLNAFLGELVAAHPHPLRGGKQPRVLFATQASTGPARFVVWASGFLEAGYRRFIERRLRETFGLIGSPIELSVSGPGEAPPLLRRDLKPGPARVTFVGSTTGCGAAW